MLRASRTLAVLLAFAMILGFTVVAIPRRAIALDNGLARTPPMGWNGYNHFHRDVTASIVEAEAQAIVTSGMKAVGYTYVNLDGGWDLLQRDQAGKLQPDPAKFPDGIKPLASYVHALGLKFGIYTSIGTENCASTSAGSYAHYQQDADTFASWGVDYVKVDWCDVPLDKYPNLTPEQVAQQLGAQMRDALAATGRPMVFDYNVNGICPNDCNDWEWGPAVANLWRISRDIGDRYSTMVRNFTSDVPLYPYAGPHGWNDPDMLEVGNGGMTDTEYRSHFSVWAELAAPLIAGDDLSTMSAATQDILTNREIIAVDQDPLGKQGHPVSSAGGHWILAKPLANGDRAVVLFNQADAPALITTSAKQAGLPAAPAYTLRDLWAHTTTESAGNIAADVPAHGAVMYRVSPASNPTAAPPSTLSTIPAPDTTLIAGQPARLTQAFTDNARLPVSDVRLRLHVPPGWSVHTDSPTQFAAVTTGKTVRVDWTVTPPATATNATLASTATYRYGPVPQPGSASASSK